jgi:hypothetical protein
MVNYSRAILKATEYLMVSGVVALSYLLGRSVFRESKEHPIMGVGRLTPVS